MSDKPESPDESKGAVRKRAPSFDEIMQGVGAEPSRPPPAPEKKKSAQPTFEEILAQAQPEASKSPSPERKSRPPRPPKEERKMPIVVRKPMLGAAPSAPPAEAPTVPAESVFAQPSAEENVDFGAMFAEV